MGLAVRLFKNRYYFSSGAETTKNVGCPPLLLDENAHYFFLVETVLSKTPFYRENDNEKDRRSSSEIQSKAFNGKL